MNLLSKRAAADCLGISPVTLMRHVANGRLAMFRIGKFAMFDPQDLDTFIAARKTVRPSSHRSDLSTPRESI